jgi:predicted phage baseplate assembly protein
MTCHCDCCASITTRTPLEVYNRPQQRGIGYRAGTFGSFRESMIARLSAYGPLRALTTRDPADPAIALLDCFAVIGDVLTFYSERIANEGYLRTATEPYSLMQLAALVGYRPRPALGASAVLAYTLDPGSTTRVPAGSGARSVPKQDELPQVFETSTDLDARADWNTLTPAMTTPLAITVYDSEHPELPDDVRTVPALTIAGAGANLRPGDRLLFLFGAVPDTAVRVIASAAPDFAAATTAVTLVGDQTPLTVAVAALVAAVGNASKNPPVSEDAAVGYLKALNDLISPPAAGVVAPGPGPTPAQALTAVAALADRLTESAALAGVRAPAAVRSWYATDVAAVLDAVHRVVLLEETLVRQAPTTVLDARELAHRALCPPGKGDDGGAAAPRSASGCDAGAALVGLTPMLPWLLRAPSSPPRAARDAVGDLAALFAPDSDVGAKLLVAADGRLAPALYTAWSNAQLTAPPALSQLQVLRTKATLAEGSDGWTIMLDTVYDGIRVGDWVVVGDSGPRQVTKATQTERLAPAGKADTIAVPATQLTLSAKVNEQPGGAVYAQGEPLTPVGDPITDDIAGHEIELDRVYDGLAPGRLLVVAGERTDVPFTSGIQAAELAMVAGVRQYVDPDDRGAPMRTFLQLTGSLSYTYRRDSVTIAGNVVEADQGETRHEILGGGAAGQPNQVLTIRQTDATHPLTFLPAATATGAKDTLEVAVSGVRWHATELLPTAGGTEHVYSFDIGADNAVSVAFGDGVHGARPQNGTDNITATLRVGAGHGGNVVGGQISQLVSRPLGVNTVTNPLPATGGADGDRPADVRASAALRMLALDRLVSVRDYQDFTRARAGIGKASAQKLFDGRRQVVHVTVAGIGDIPIDASSGLLRDLQAALVALGDVGVPVAVDVREQIMLVVRAGIKVAPDYDWDLVEPAVRAALLEAFGFASRDLAQDAYLSEVIALAAAVPGVDYVDVDVFDGIPASITPVELISVADRLASPRRVVRAAAAAFVEDRDTVRAGETLTTFALRMGLSVDEVCALNPDLPDITPPERTPLVVRRGIRPAQIAVLPGAVAEALTLRRIP